MTSTSHDGEDDRPLLDVDAELEQILGSVEHAIDEYLRGGTDAQRDALVEALAALDLHTARSDAYESSFANAPFLGFTTRGSVLGETSSHPFVERVAGEEFDAQVELVKAAKRELDRSSLHSIEELRAASATLQSVRGRRPPAT